MVKSVLEETFDFLVQIKQNQYSKHQFVFF